MADTLTLGSLTIVAVETPSLGDRSYLVHDGEVAFAVDPQRDLDRVTDLLDEHGVTLTHVFETHLHNDYVTGGLALAQATGAAYLVNGADDVSYERSPLSDGDVIEIGERMRVTALSTPGHTFTHLSYALTDASSAPALDAAVAVFSGGSLLFGSTGRPDLLGEEHTHDLARHQHASAQRLASMLPDDAGVFPTHGFGSFCAATPVRRDRVDHRRGEAEQPGPDPGRGDLRRGAPRRARCLAGLLRAHAAPQRRGPRRRRPEPGAPQTPPRYAAASRPASGWSTCATGPRSPPDTRPAP